MACEPRPQLQSILTIYRVFTLVSEARVFESFAHKIVKIEVTLGVLFHKLKIENNLF